MTATPDLRPAGTRQPGTRTGDGRHAGTSSGGQRLAVAGGSPTVGPDAGTGWPVVLDADRAAVLAALDSGVLVSDRNTLTPVDELEREWAHHTRVRHCVAVSNGTVALQFPLAAAGIGPGDEVIVPALSFVATAMAVLHQGATPVFADIDPVTFNIDAAHVEQLITGRTAAVVPVHLHGLPARMDRLVPLARRHGLLVLEDAAQAHGAHVDGRPVGALGDAAAFSLQVSKNLPTCGEGGLITTDDEQLAATLRRMRQFGEVVERGRPRSYVSHSIGWNGKLSTIQAAFARSQLERLAAYTALRARNIAAFLQRLAALPGLLAPAVDRPGAEHVWHILRFRFDAEQMGLPADLPAEAVRAALHRVLRAEGVPLTRYQVVPLPGQPVFAGLLPDGDGVLAAQWPHASEVVAGTLTLQQRHLNPHAGPLLDSYAQAFEKVWEHLDTVAALARSRS